jgi:hypothetical protein
MSNVPEHLRRTVVEEREGADTQQTTNELLIALVDAVEEQTERIDTSLSEVASVLTAIRRGQGQ